jgi:hypothetical protein
MSGEPNHKSHAVAWTLSVAAVPVLYLLSIGPVVGLAENDTIPNDPPPEWLTAFYMPYEWLYWNTPLQAPLEAYKNWWIEALAKRPTPN